MGDRHELEEIGADVGEERVDPEIGSLPLSEPRATAKGERDYPQSGNEADAAGGQVDSTDLAPHSDEPGFVSVSENRHGRKGRGVTTEGSKTSERDLDLGSDVEHAMQSGPSRGQDGVGREEVDRVDPPPSTSSIELKSMPTAHCSIHYL